MSRKKQLEENENDLSEYRRLNKPTYYPIYIHKELSDEVLEERAAKACLNVERWRKERRVREKC